MLVLDASAALAWAYAEEAGRPDEVIDHVTANGGHVPAHWILDEAKALPDVDVELIDLRDYPLPHFDEPASPIWKDGSTR